MSFLPSISSSTFNLHAYLSLLATELKFQWRHGFIIAAIVITLVWAMFLSFLPQADRAFWFGVVAALDVSAIGLLFGFGLGVLDKTQQTITAIRLTPVNSSVLAMARISALTILMTATLMLIALIVLDFSTIPKVIAGVFSMSLFFSAMGVTASRRFGNINQFIIFFAFSSLIWALPILYYADILTSKAWLLLPSGGATALLSLSFKTPTLNELLFSLLIQIIWIDAVIYLGERWASVQFEHRFGGH